MILAKFQHDIPSRSGEKVDFNDFAILALAAILDSRPD